MRAHVANQHHGAPTFKVNATSVLFKRDKRSARHFGEVVPMVVYGRSALGQIVARSVMASLMEYLMLLAVKIVSFK